MIFSPMVLVCIFEVSRLIASSRSNTLSSAGISINKKERHLEYVGCKGGMNKSFFKIFKLKL